ncbi:MAG: iron donor protein CyaY [Myxococcales bacterium]|nr:iron donor protein CyaY [Myxococcota bacterium]MDW8282509.1 iron donor protein CyaY [Myxococcales bacterium]
MNPHQQQDQAFDDMADAQLRRLERALSELDPDEVEADLAGDVLTLTLRDGTRIVINRHRAARQIWMAALRQAWHFNPEDQGRHWRTAQQREELVSTLERVLSQQLGRPIQLPGARMP